MCNLTISSRLNDGEDEVDKKNFQMDNKED